MIFCPACRGTNVSKHYKTKFMNEIKSKKLIEHIEILIDEIVQKKGPDETDYSKVSAIMKDIGELRANGFLKNDEILEFHKKLGEAWTTIKTLPGFVCVKPHGYAGDFEIIDKIYTNAISEDTNLKKWDSYFHSLEATKAVRNRKTYFKHILKSKSSGIKVLNLASGPCRDIVEFYEESDQNVHFDCIELDMNAIEYGKGLLQKIDTKIKNVNFIHKDILKFCTKDEYDLIWSGGLFDYFEDKIFIRVLKRFLKNIKKGGELVIGNFHPRNPSRAIMEFGFWYLHHRTEDDLIRLAHLCGVDNDRIEIKSECEGVNLFLHIKNCC